MYSGTVAKFKQEAVAFVTGQGYSVPKAAASLGSTDKLLYNWKAKFDAEQSGSSLNSDERSELFGVSLEKGKYPTLSLFFVPTYINCTQRTVFTGAQL
nr:transposase [Providencia stuartii]